MLIKFANADVEVFKVKQGVVVMLDHCYYHIFGFCVNNSLFIGNGYNKPFAVNASQLTWLEPF